MTRLLVATTNQGKLAELQPALGALGWELCGLQEFPAVPVAREDGASFAENARAKALHYARATGCAALADDSGLCVDALGGAPGVWSARYAGEGAGYAANVRKLLREMAAIEPARRTARFRTVCVACFPDRDPIVAEGVLEGRITEVLRGTEGFGYDPVFEVAGTTRTLAELPFAEKNRLSHRGSAVTNLARMLRG